MLNIVNTLSQSDNHVLPKTSEGFPNIKRSVTRKPHTPEMKQAPSSADQCLAWCPGPFHTAQATLDPGRGPGRAPEIEETCGGTYSAGEIGGSK
mgnify:CR=1 FL=1